MTRRTTSIFIAALGVRVATIAYLARATPQVCSWGINEAGAIARWIATTHSYSSPFHDASFPTAWLPPVFPLIVAAIFSIFGVETSTATIATMIFNAVCGAITAVFVYEIGKLIYSEKAGWFAAWMWAFSPYLALLPCLMWDTSLSALSLSAILWLTLRLQSQQVGEQKVRVENVNAHTNGIQNICAWFACGAAWGFAALVNPALLAPFPAITLLRLRTIKLRCALVAAVSVVIVITPWTVRNYQVFHRIIPVRSNGLTELYFTNVSYATHPLGTSMEYQRLGEPAFTEQTGRLAVAYVRSHPRAFMLESLRRAALFWIYPFNFCVLVVAIDAAALAGLVILFRRPTDFAIALLSVVVFYPITYYITLAFSRFRHPIEPILYALAGIAVARLTDGKRARHATPSIDQR